MGQLLQRDPLDRPCLEEILQHPFCADSMQEAVVAEGESSLRLRDANAHEQVLAALDSLDDEDDDLPQVATVLSPKYR